MNIVFNNPYRVLGLISPISNKELAKRTNDLQTFVEFGKSPSYDLDISSTVIPIVRGIDNIKDAARHLESDNDKVFYALFWFYKSDAVDELAFDAIKEGSLEKAYDLWDKQIQRSTDPKFSWLINSNVLCFFEIQKQGFSFSRFHQIVNNYGTLLQSIEQVKNEVLQSGKNTVNNSAIGEKLIDNLINYVKADGNDYFGQYNLEMLDTFSNYPVSFKDYATSKIMTPCLIKVEDIIGEVKQILEDGEDWAIYGAIEQLKGIEGLVRELDLYSNDYKVQSLINEYSKVANDCSFFILNELDDDAFAKEVASWVAELPAYGQTKNKIDEEQGILVEVIENKSIYQKFDGLLEYLNFELYSMSDSEWLLNEIVKELRSITCENEKERETYIKLASSSVFKLINHAFKTYNESFDVFKIDADLNYLKTIVNQCHQLVLNIQIQFRHIEIEDKARNYINKAVSHFGSEKNEIEKVSSQARGNNRLPVVRKPDKPMAGGVFYALGEKTGMNSNYMRVGYVIAALATGVWPLVVLYAALTIIKNFIENNAK